MEIEKQEKQEKETDKKEAVMDLFIDKIETLTEEQSAAVSGGSIGFSAWPGWFPWQV